MRTLSSVTVILALSLLAAGCSSTQVSRSGISPKMRTVASIGDRPLPVVSGEPGATVVAATDDPVRPVKREGRITGRVVDDLGEPVPNARVRIAVGGIARGRDVSATTDESGAFTLSGLLPGSSYTVIAESKDGLEVRTGQSQAHAPETNIEISLAPLNDHAEQAAGPKRISPISNRKPTIENDEESTEGEDLPASLNVEDIGPPPPEADSFTSDSPSRARRGTPSSAAAPDEEAHGTAGWRRHDSVKSRAASTPEKTAPSHDPEPQGEAAPLESTDLDDDGPNPLPPALERGSTSATTPEPAGESLAHEPEAMSATASEPAGELLAQAQAARPSRRRDRQVADRLPSRPDSDDLPGTKTVVPKTYAPISLAEAPSKSKRSVRVSAQSSDDPSPRVLRSPAAPAEADPHVTPTRKRATWEELDAISAEPPLERASVAPALSGRSPDPGRPGDNSRLVSNDTPARRGLLRRAATAGTGTPEPMAYCRYDQRKRELIDFQLPDLEGRPVRFQDLDADLILLDFWGTWCQPCLASLPHLVELQKASDSKRLKVVGIACEQGPRDQRIADVSRAIQKYGINYPVLMSAMEAETCPVQQALHIQAFPTLILMDRQGHLLWRDAGATPTTLARLDRFLASVSKAGKASRF
jgi:thiol-disulfide isomerase/thioredoxin